MRFLRRREDELREEISAHLRMAAQDRVDRGEPPSEAVSAAEREFGNVALVKETTRDVWSWTSLERIWQDLRYGARSFARTPSFTIAAILTLSLGIASATAIFSVVYAVLLAPLPFSNPERLVRLWESKPQSGVHRNVVNPRNFFDWRARNRSFEAVSVTQGTMATLTSSGEPEVMFGMQVSPEFFSILGVQPQIGRAFLREEETPGRHDRIILGHNLWQRRFGGNPNIAGKKLNLNGELYTVVGVMPAGFTFSSDTYEFWIPFPRRNDASEERGRYLTAMARLKPGVTLQQAREDLAGIAKRLESERPKMNRNWSAEVIPILDDMTEGVRLPLLVLLGAVGLLLLIACSNVANLMLMRGAGRVRDIAVRTALGASRGRIVRQLVTESMLLAAAACAIGLIASHWALKGLMLLLPENGRLPRMGEAALNLPILSFAILLSIATAVLFGLFPAFRLGRIDSSNALKQGTQRAGVGGNRTLKKLFVAVQVALSIVLLAGAGLIARSFVNLLSVDPGFRPSHLLTMQIVASPIQFEDERKRAAYADRILEELRDTPGVESAGGVLFLPMTDRFSGSCFGKATEPPPDVSSPSAQFHIITEGYLPTMGIPLLAGRDFDRRDRIGSRSVALVNEAFAKRHFPQESPVGKLLNVCWTVPNPVEIVGVVANARQADLRTEPQPGIFLPHAQSPSSLINLVVRTRSDPRKTEHAAIAAVHRINPEQGIFEVKRMEEVMAESVARPRFQLTLLLVFAAIALILATVGVYGVVAFSVAERTPEIGLRVALGASRKAVIGMIVGEGITLALLGIVVGLACAILSAHVLVTLLYGVDPLDPGTFFLVCLIVLTVAVFASTVPALRASRVDPARALRCE